MKTFIFSWKVETWIWQVFWSPLECRCGWSLQFQRWLRLSLFVLLSIRTRSHLGLESKSNKNVFGAKIQIIFFSVEVSYLVKSITSPNEKWSPKEIPKWCERNAKSPIVFKRNQKLWKSRNLPRHFPSAVKINVPHFKQCRKSIRQTQCTFHWTIYFVDLPPSKISFTPIVLGVGNTFLVESTQKFPALQMS